MDFNNGTDKLVYYGGMGPRSKHPRIIPELGQELTVTEIEFCEDETYMVSFEELKHESVNIKYDIDFFVSKKLWDTSNEPVQDLLENTRSVSTFYIRHPKCVCFVASEEDKKGGKCSQCSGSL